MTWKDYLTPAEQLTLQRIDSSRQEGYVVKRRIYNRARQRMFRDKEKS